MDEFLTAREVASMLKISVDTVIRRLSDYPGVIDLGRAETSRKRRYRCLRIPRAVFDRFVSENAIR